jgi:hypothetical protein
LHLCDGGTSARNRVPTLSQRANGSDNDCTEIGSPIFACLFKGRPISCRCDRPSHGRLPSVKRTRSFLGIGRYSCVSLVPRSIGPYSCVPLVPRSLRFKSARFQTESEAMMIMESRQLELAEAHCSLSELLPELELRTPCGRMPIIIFKIDTRFRAFEPGSAKAPN